MGLGPNPGPTPAWRCLTGGYLRETQGSGRRGIGQDMRLGDVGRRGYPRTRTSAMVGEEREAESKEGRRATGDQLGSSMEQVRRWNNGRVRVEGQCLERQK